ncbi:MAG: hypothetical protein EOM55_03665 [Clostridia bacterium]|nr:hypothetical protein [Clostridia bacterium]
MILQNENIKFKVQGLNLKKFLQNLSKNKIEVVEFEKLEYNLFFFTIKKKNEFEFLKLVKRFNYKVDENKLSFLSRKIRLIRNNLVFFVSAIVMVFLILFSSNFVFQTKIEGLCAVRESEVLKVLDENGFEMGKFKTNYNLDSVEKILTAHLEKISYASAVIKGNTLVINIDEKIDNSEYIYNYSPIFAPFDCVINSIELLSGTANYLAGQTVKAGEVIVSPYVVYVNSQKLPVPAKAKINAYVEINCHCEYEMRDYQKNSQKYIEELTKELYNKNEDKYNIDDLEKLILESSNDGNCLLTIILKGNIYF